MPGNPRAGGEPMRANLKPRQLLVAALVVAAGFGLGRRGLAGLVAGGGKKPENDCLVELRVGQSTSAPTKCTDCDPNCDADGQNQANKACTYKLAVCVNQANVSCCAGAGPNTASA